MERSSTLRFVSDSPARGQRSARAFWEGSAAQAGRPMAGSVFGGSEAVLDTFRAPISGQLSRILAHGQAVGAVISSRMWQTAVVPADGVIVGGRIDAVQGEFSLVTDGNVECIMIVKSLKDVRGRNELTPFAWPGEHVRAGQRLVTCHGDGMVVELLFSLFSSQRIGMLFPNRSYVTAGQNVLQVFG